MGATGSPCGPRSRRIRPSAPDTDARSATASRRRRVRRRARSARRHRRGTRRRASPVVCAQSFAQFAREPAEASSRRASRCGIRGGSRARRCARGRSPPLTRAPRAVQETCSEKRPTGCSTDDDMRCAEDAEHAARRRRGGPVEQLASGAGAGALSASPSLFPATSAGAHGELMKRHRPVLGRGGWGRGVDGELAGQHGLARRHLPRHVRGPALEREQRRLVAVLAQSTNSISPPGRQARGAFGGVGRRDRARTRGTSRRRPRAAPPGCNATRSLRVTHIASSSRPSSSSTLNQSGWSPPSSRCSHHTNGPSR